MNNITIQPLTASYLAAVVELQLAYAAAYPQAQVIPAEVYLSPAFENGRNIFCALDESGRLLGYAPLYPVLIREPSAVPHVLWVEIKAHPACEAQNEIKDQLLQQILLRSHALTCEAAGHPVHLTFQYFPSETASIAYALSKGCQHTESIFTMQRDLSMEIPAVQSLGEMTIRPWQMETEAEQQQYLRARNECFPETPTTLEELQYFMRSPQWSVGTTFAAFDGEELAGSVTVFWDEAENRRSGKRIGFTEYIFVRSPWRGRNIARNLIQGGLAHLRHSGLEAAVLEVRAQNQGALRLYLDLGYKVVQESRFYVLAL